MFWFHCGRCGSLFQSQAGDSDDRVCSKCGARPELGIEPQAAAPQTKPTLPLPDGATLPKRGDRRKGSASANGNNRLLVKIIGGWSLVLALIILGARFLWHQDAPVGNQASVPVESGGGNPEEYELLQAATTRCSETLQNYLGAATLEEKTQFVLTPSKTTTMMVRFYGSNPIERVDPAELKLSEQHLLHLPGGKAVETLWSIKDSRRIEAVFREEGDSWKLDWVHFARYSDQPWALFLAGSGESESEFRLLARERLAKERQNENDISVVLYSPRFGDPGETGYQSPEFNILRNSADGRLLDAAFHLKREGKSAYQSTIAKHDPDEMIRVRVRVTRSETDGVRKFTINRVIACHWYEHDEPGVEVTDDTPRNKPESK
jgi:hypothetical protein